MKEDIDLAELQLEIDLVYSRFWICKDRKEKKKLSDEYTALATKYNNVAGKRIYHTKP